MHFSANLRNFYTWKYKIMAAGSGRGPKFDNSKNKAFADDLKKEVNNYFTLNNINKSGGFRFMIKIPVVFGIFFVPYLLVLSGILPMWANWLMALVMGCGIASIGLVVMHDANHKNASSHNWLNRMLTYTMSFLGGSPVLWRIQHNVLHHTYTNIEHFDEDILTIPLLRFSPHSELKKVHRFQDLYAWFFYSLLTFSWAGHDDFIQLVRYNKRNLLQSQKTNFTKELWGIIFTKMFYYSYLIVIPLLVTDLHWWQILIGYMSLHIVAGLALSLIFQAAHVNEEAQYEDGSALLIEENWLVHQLNNTRNFAVRSRWFTWIVGGLNHQVEHHLFPNISHVHYPRISRIIKKVARRHDIPYYEAGSLFTAVRDHFLFLRQLGRA